MAGVDFDVLFAPPTPGELAAVRAAWASRDVKARDAAPVAIGPILLGSTPALYQIVSHSVGTVTHFGAIVTPLGAADGSLPVLVYAHGGDRGVDLAEVQLIAAALGSLGGRFVYVVPSFRSEAISVGGESYVSGGEASPWDRDVDDALALLEVALGTTPAADPEAVAVVGISRGAGVGLLMAIREPRIDQVVEFFGPTDFLDTFVQDVVEEALLGRPRDLPGLAVLNARFLGPLAAGSTSIPAVRVELIRRSAVYFVEELPQVQVHHGTADGVVEVSQAERLIEAAASAGRTAPDFEGFLYPGGGHNPLALPGAVGRVAAFLGRLQAGSNAVAVGTASSRLARNLPAR